MKKVIASLLVLVFSAFVCSDSLAKVVVVKKGPHKKVVINKAPHKTVVRKGPHKTVIVKKYPKKAVVVRRGGRNVVVVKVRKPRAYYPRRKVIIVGKPFWYRPWKWRARTRIIVVEAPVREHPNADAVVIAKLPEGKQYEVVERYDDWCKLRWRAWYGGVKTGWVKADNVEVLEVKEVEVKEGEDVEVVEVEEEEEIEVEGAMEGEEVEIEED